MKQIIQNLRDGKTALVDVPCPVPKPGYVLIQTSMSLVSAGTERMLVEFGNANFIRKALSQRERFGEVIDKIRSDGWVPAVKRVLNKLDTPISLGYSNVGKVIGVGDNVTGFHLGDRVVSNGPHAEVVCVPKNLVAKIPESVSDDQAVFTVPAAIALQGIRLLNSTLGETIVVVGLGLIGLLAAELLRGSGCRVIGMDVDEDRLKMAALKKIIVHNPNQGGSDQLVSGFTDGVGADGVLITATSERDEIISQAFKMTRKRGKVVLIGDVGLDISRKEMYEKELTFQVSSSYGPGRYDPAYEENGIDYPIEHARWTANRNFQAVLQQFSAGLFDVKHISTRYLLLTDFGKVYSEMDTEKTVATIFTYPDHTSLQHNVVHKSWNGNAGNGVIGIIGAGNFTRSTLLPMLKNRLIKYIASAGGLSGTLLARKYGIALSTTDYRTVLGDHEVDLVMITTRHDEHAGMVGEALKAGKHVFVEKPLAIFEHELKEVVETYKGHSDSTLTIGFNRRFSPFIVKMKELLGNEPMTVSIAVNAGHLPKDSWLLDRNVGGGRIIGEACHFIDLVCYLTGSRMSSVCATSMGEKVSATPENVSIILKCQNGSTGVIHYFSNGHKAYSKERVEVSSLGRTLILDNFQTLTGYGFGNFYRMQASQDKGHERLLKNLLNMIQKGGEPIIPFDQIVNSTEATFAVMESLVLGAWVDL